SIFGPLPDSGAQPQRYKAAYSYETSVMKQDSSAQKEQGMSRQSRRASVRKSDLSAALSAFAAQGLKPCAVDQLPTGGIRWHFAPPTDTPEDEFDRELAAFEAQHGKD